MQCASGFECIISVSTHHSLYLRLKHSYTGKITIRPLAVNQNLLSYLCPPSHLLCIDSQTIERSQRHRDLVCVCISPGLYFSTVHCTWTMHHYGTHSSVPQMSPTGEQHINNLYQKKPHIKWVWIVFQSHFITCSITHQNLATAISFRLLSPN